MSKNSMKFKTKAYVVMKAKKPFINKILKVILPIYSIITIVVVIASKMSSDVITFGVIPTSILFYFYNSTKPESSYEVMDITVSWDDKEIYFIYDIKEERAGKAEVLFNYDNIKGIQYDETLECISIDGYPIETRQTSKDEKVTENWMEKNIETTIDIYVSGKEKDDIINCLKEYTDKDVVTID